MDESKRCLSRRQKIKNKKVDWNEWFAGIVDGDGCFYINKQKQISFEITTHTSDSRILYNIKNKLKGGSVKLRSGSNSVRFRVKQNSTIVDIVTRLNGKLKNSNRVKQFSQVCHLLKISPLSTPKFITTQNGYLSGLIDSDGTVTISVSHSSQINSQKSGKGGKITRLRESRGHNQIYLKITSNLKQNLEFIQQSYKIGIIRQGHCVPSKANPQKKCPNIKYQWIVTSYEDFICLYEYLKKYPLKSVKMHRIRLVSYYFKYKQLNYHLKTEGSLEYKIWTKFCKSWFKYSA